MHKLVDLIYIRIRFVTARKKAARKTQSNVAIWVLLHEWGNLHKSIEKLFIKIAY